MEICERGFSHSNFLDRWKDVESAFLYIIEVFSQEESFTKIGITSKPFEERYNLNICPFDVDIVDIVEDSPSCIFKMEKNIHKKYRKQRATYRPCDTFFGVLETFLIDDPYSIL